MNQKVQTAVLSVLEEADHAYRNSYDFGSANDDFAGFVGMALSDFKSALDQPGLTRENLESVIRQGMSTHRNSGQPREGWASFMATYVTKAVNEAHF